MTSGPEWIDPIGDEIADRRVGSVQAALLTTYDPPDATVLVEELLPRWFCLNREMSSDDAANRFFLVELEAELQRRRGNLAVFASPAVLGPDSRHWIWSHVARHFVGARGPVVQHAKLWLLSRVDDTGTERLDIHVSSTNLTRSAIREQVQAGFRCLVPLDRRESRNALRSWGTLASFLQELGNHAGPAGAAAVVPWLRRFARCRCPDDVSFIASVPGMHRGSDWGVRALGKALRLPARTEVDILVPTVGSWTKDQVKSWAKAVGTLARRVGLAWITKGHPWAKNWELPGPVVAALESSGVALLALGEEDEDERRRLHRSFVKYDERWPHAKVYWFERGASPRVLVTSANWSPSAWGIFTTGNQLYIKNFELGALLTAEKRPLRTLKEMTAPPATVYRAHDIEGTAPWAHATFDGRRLVVQIVKEEVAPREILVMGPNDDQLRLKVNWRTTDGLLQAVLNRVWKAPPSAVAILLKGAKHWLAVQDLRSAEEFPEQPLNRPPGIEEGELKRLRARLLEERYGGKLMEDYEHSPNGRPSSAKLVAPVCDYAVWLLDEARHVFGVIDTWVATHTLMERCDMRDAIERDGRELLRLWRDEIKANSRRKGALTVACDELQARLRRSA